MPENLTQAKSQNRPRQLSTQPMKLSDNPSSEAEGGPVRPSQRFLDELASWKPGQRVEFLSQLLATEIIRMFGVEFFSLELKVMNGEVTDIRPLLNIKPVEMRKRV